MARKKTLLALVEAPPTPIRLRFGRDLPIKEENETYVLVDSLRSFEEGSVEHIVSYLHFHRLSREDRYTFADEVWRVLAPKKQLTLVVPYYTSHLAIADPLAQWPPLCEGSFLVYSKEWREREKLLGLPLKCDFEQNFVAGHIPEPDLGVRNEEYRAFGSRHWWNTVREFHVTLTKREVRG